MKRREAKLLLVLLLQLCIDTQLQIRWMTWGVTSKCSLSLYYERWELKSLKSKLISCSSFCMKIENFACSLLNFISKNITIFPNSHSCCLFFPNNNNNYQTCCCIKKIVYFNHKSYSKYLLNAMSFIYHLIIYPSCCIGISGVLITDVPQLLRNA